MAKNITELATVTALDTNWIHHSDGVDDYKTNVLSLLRTTDDLGMIYDPGPPVIISQTPINITASTRSDSYAKGFTVDETTGFFTFNAAGVGVLYRATFSYIIPQGMTNQQYFAQLNVGGVTRLMDVCYISSGNVNDDTVALAGTLPFVGGADGTTAAVQVAGTAIATSQQPIAAYVAISAA